MVVANCSSLYTTKAVMNSMASGLGPLVSVVLFALLGNKWEVRPYSAHSSSAQLLVVWLSMKVFIAAFLIFGIRHF